MAGDPGEKDIMTADERSELDALLENERTAHAETRESRDKWKQSHDVVTRRLADTINELNRLRESGTLQDNAKSTERRISALELRVLALETDR